MRGEREEEFRERQGERKRERRGLEKGSWRVGRERKRWEDIFLLPMYTTKVIRNVGVAVSICISSLIKPVCKKIKKLNCLLTKF